MAATLQDVRRLALALPEVEEGVCFGTPTFYLRKKLMLRMKEDGETLVVKMPIHEREALIDAHPDVFSVTEHYRTYPAILVSLPNVRLERLAKLIDAAWTMVASKKQLAFRQTPTETSKPNPQATTPAPRSKSANRPRP